MRPVEIVDVVALSFGDAPVVVGLFSDGSGAGRGAEAVRSSVGVDIVDLARRDGAFRSERGDLTTLVVSARDGTPIVFTAVGLGVRTQCDAGALREAAAHVARGRGHGGVVTTLALELDDAAAAVRAVVEGEGLGGYRYHEPGTDGEGVPDPFVVVVAAPVPESVVRAAIVATNAANWVRRLVETPSSELGPAEFAEAIAVHARDVAGDAVTVSVWTGRQLAERGFAATLAVGAASARPPCVVEMRTHGAGTALALAGKGITFDSGGINLKRDAGELAWMKSDMAAGAAVAAAVIAARVLGATAPMIALVPIAENMPGGNALRPGDVLTHPDGRTTEVVDTDCEGRLVLADAIAWLARSHPRAIIDVGTLTDSGGVGPALWGCWSTEPVLGNALVDAGERAGEPGWLLPLHPAYDALLSSPVADMANASNEVADSGQLAATYLRGFAGSTPWVHVDNGSCAYLEHRFGPWPVGATGSPVRALIEFLRRETGDGGAGLDADRSS